MLGVKLNKERFVTLPEEETEAAKLSVDISKMVPAGLEFSPKVAEALVL